MTISEMILIGGGGHALVVADAAKRSGRPITGFLDDHPRAVLGATGLKYLGAFDAPIAASTALFLAIGQLAARRAWITKIAKAAPPVLHPTADISPSAAVGVGVYVGPRAVIHTLANVGDHAIINTGAIVEHECRIGVNTHLAPGAILGGRVSIGDDTMIGLGARILPNLRIGRGCVIGAGALVTRDIPDGTTVIGIPAKPRLD